MNKQKNRFGLLPQFVIMLLACLLVNYGAVFGEVSFSVTPTQIGVTVSDVTAETETSTLVKLDQNYVVGLTEIFSGDPNTSNELAADQTNRSYSYLAFYKSSSSDSFPATKTSDGSYNQSESTTDNVNVSCTRSYSGDLSATVNFSKAGYWRVVFIVSVKQPKRGTDGNIVYDSTGNISYETILTADCEMDFIAAKINMPTCKEKAYGMDEFKSTEDGNVIWDCDEHEYSVIYTPSDLTDVKLYKKSAATSPVVQAASVKSASTKSTQTKSASIKFNPRSTSIQSQAYWQSGIPSDNTGSSFASSLNNTTDDQESFFLAVDQSDKGKVDDGNTLGKGNHNITARKENGKNPIDSDEKNIFQAKLKSITWRNYETAQKSGEIRFAKLADGKVFPEKIDPNEGSYNHVVIDVQIEEKIPQDLTGTISFTVLDPMNQCETSKGDRIGSGINDNGTCQMNYKTFSISMTEEKGTQTGVRLSIDPAQPGANFIIAGHPRKEAMEKIVIRTTDSSDKNYKTPIISGGNGNEQIVQTELLTVWRTLWCELDQMEKPGYNIQDIAVMDYKKPPEGDNVIARRELFFADADKDKKWGEEEPKNEDQTFDLHKQPPLPKTALLTQLLKQACVLVKEYDKNEFKELPFAPVLDSRATNMKTWEGEMNDQEYGQRENGGIPYRSIPESSKDYWTIHVISAYEGHYDDHDNHEGFEGRVAFNCVMVDNGKLCKHLSGTNGHTAYIFYETLRDKCVTHGECKNICPLKYSENIEFETCVDTDTYFDRIVAHEVLHSFLGGHNDGQELSDPVSISDQTIMNYHIFYKEFDCNFNKQQIQHIQKLSYPRGINE